VATVRGWDAEKKRMLDEIESLEQEALELLRQTAATVLTHVMSATPVWSGETVASYAWGVNGGAPQGPARRTGLGEEGTNDLPLGPEMFRPGAEQIAIGTARATFRSLKKLADLSLHNLTQNEATKPNVYGYEAGGQKFDRIYENMLPGPKFPNYRTSDLDAHAEMGVRAFGSKWRRG
jgi:hypothetical protein